jgi:tetratricopeptide (TPR) repeat protein
MPDVPQTRPDVERLLSRYNQAPQSRLFAPLAAAYRAAGDSEEALRVLRAGLARHPQYVSALVLMAQCCLDLQQEDAAESAFARVLELDPENLVALRYRAERARRRGALERAVELLRLLLEIDPFDREVQADLGLVAMALEREASGDRPAADEPTLDTFASAPHALAARIEPPAVRPPIDLEADVKAARPEIAPRTTPAAPDLAAQARDSAANDVVPESLPTAPSEFVLPPIDLRRVGRPVLRSPEESPETRGSLFAPRRDPESPKPEVETRSPIERAVESSGDAVWRVTRREDHLIVSPNDAPLRGPIRSVEDRLWSEQRGTAMPLPGPLASPPPPEPESPSPALDWVSPPESPPATEPTSTHSPAADEFATLTLARIYESQGYLERALSSIYDELHRKHPENGEVSERLAALQRRLAGIADALPEPPVPLAPSAPPPSPGETIADDAVRWRLVDRGTVPERHDTASHLRQVTEDVRASERNRRHTLIGAPPASAPPPPRAEPEPAPEPTTEDLTRGHADFQRFLKYVRSLKP